MHFQGILNTEESEELKKLSNNDAEPHYALEAFVIKLKTQAYSKGYQKAKKDIVEFIENQDRFDVVN